MAKTLTNCTVWFDKRDFSGQSNQVSIGASAAQLDTTTFANLGQARLAGLRDAVISVAGLWEDTADPDAVIQADVGQNVPITIAVARAAPVGTVAYLMNALVAEYGNIGAKVGNPLTFNLKCAQGGSTLPLSASINSGRLAQGQVALNQVITANGSSSVFGPLPAPLIQQSVVAALHVFAVSGSSPTLSMTLKSSASAGMTSPTTRITFGAGGGSTFTAPGSDIADVTGPITDTYWQFNWAVTGTSPSFTVAASIGNAY